MKIYLVGGAVRDQLLGLHIKEKDYVVVGATVEQMLSLGFRQVGKEFPVFLHPKTYAEYALARAERKVRPGYQGFVFDTSPNVTLEEDLKRRDLTINAMAYDEENKELIDPFHGKVDIEKRLLRHVSKAFAEDPVRILRVGRFLARFAHLGFVVEPETLQLMRQMVDAGEVNALVPERVWKELERALQEKSSWLFFRILDECHALPILFPELNINGDGIKALQLNHPDKRIRFAVLLHEQVEMAKIVCQRYRVPNEFRHLALLTAQFHADFIDLADTDADLLLSLLSRVDAFRRSKRFMLFLEACACIAEIKQTSFNRAWWQQLAHEANQIDVPSLIDAGFKHRALVEQIYQLRKQKINTFLTTNA